MSNLHVPVSSFAMGKRNHAAKMSANYGKES